MHGDGIHFYHEAVTKSPKASEKFGVGRIKFKFFLHIGMNVQTIVADLHKP